MPNAGELCSLGVTLSSDTKPFFLTYHVPFSHSGHPIPSPLGEKIRTLREEKGLSLEKLAKLTDSSKGYLWELENRDSPNPSIDKIDRIARELGVTVEFLVSDTVSTPDQEVADQAFFRRYQDLKPETKAKISKFLEMWEE